MVDSWIRLLLNTHPTTPPIASSLAGEASISLASCYYSLYSSGFAVSWARLGRSAPTGRVTSTQTVRVRHKHAVSRPRLKPTLRNAAAAVSFSRGDARYRLLVARGLSSLTGVLAARAARLGSWGGELTNDRAVFIATSKLVTRQIRHVSLSHLRLLPDVVVRAHQVAQQEVELLLLVRHCSEIQKDQPGGEAAKWARQT